MADDSDRIAIVIVTGSASAARVALELSRGADVAVISYDEVELERFVNSFQQPLRGMEIRNRDIAKIRLENQRRAERLVDRAVRFDLQAPRDWDNRDYRRPKRRRK